MASTLFHTSHGACKATDNKSWIQKGPHERIVQLRGLAAALLYLETVDSPPPSPQLSLDDVSWAAVRDLKAKFEDVWKGLESQKVIDTDPSSKEVLLQLLSKYRNAHELSQKGLLVLQRLLSGEAEILKDLPAIFAGMAVSNCMYSHLSQQHRQTYAFNPINISLWVEALPRRKRLLLERFWKVLWPDLDYSPYLSVQSEEFETLPSPCLDPQLFGTEQCSTNCNYSQSYGLSASNAHGAQDLTSSYHRSSASSSSFGYDLSIQAPPQHQHQAPTHSQDQAQYAIVGSQFPQNLFVQPFAPPTWLDPQFLGHPGHPASFGLTGFQPQHNGNVMAQGQPESNAYMSTEPSSSKLPQADSHLRNIYDFLDHLGEMPFKLTVGQVVVKGALEMQEHRDETKHYVADFIKPLLSCRKERGWDFQCEAIVSVAEEYLEEQFFQDLDETVDFMNHLAAALFPDDSSQAKAFGFKVAKTLQGAKERPGRQGSQKTKKRLPCPQCDQVIADRRANLKRHMDTAHPGHNWGN